jgi:tryptophan 2,3-dioxygenase
MAKQSAIDRINSALFDPMPGDTSAQEEAIAVRYRDAFTYWLDNPMASDADIRDYLMNCYQLSKSQAYRDIANIKLLLGNVRNAGKEWHRHRVNVLLEQGAKAGLEGQTAIATAISKIATAMIKNNRLDMDDGEQIPYDEIVPPTWEPTTDPTVIGIKPIPNLRERISELYKKLADEIEITEVPYEDVTTGDERQEESLLQ